MLILLYSLLVLFISFVIIYDISDFNDYKSTDVYIFHLTIFILTFVYLPIGLILYLIYYLKQL